MNVSELQNYVYSAATNSIASINGSTKTSTVASNVGNATNSTQAVNAFSSALSEEVDKLNNSVQQADKVAEFKKLATALDGSVLGTMVSNASEKDLAVLSEDLLGSKGGKDVLSRLMEGHFNSIVMSDSDDDDKEDSLLDSSTDSLSKSIDDTQALLDSLEKVSAGMQTEDK